MDLGSGTVDLVSGCCSHRSASWAGQSSSGDHW